jgi:epoxyqueuosine reductase
MSSFDLSRASLTTLAAGADLTVTGVTDGAPFRDVEDFVVDHVERGHMTGMDWFTVERVRQSTNPRILHDTVRTIVSVGVPFWSGAATQPSDGILRGKIARYAWGRDYHNTLKRRMRQLVDAIEQHVGRAV